MEVIPGLHLFKGMGNAYLVEGEEGLVLVDSGGPGDIAGFVDYIRERERPLQALTHIFVTHADVDHAGKVAALVAATGARVHAGPETARLLAAAQTPPHMPAPLQWISDRLTGYTAVPADAIHVVHDEEELPVLGGLMALATPGHTSDHFAYYCRQSGLLFAGDALQSRGGRLGLLPRLITGDADAAARSALRLLALNPAVYACGHGAPLTKHMLADVLALSQKLRRQLGEPLVR